MADQKRLGTEAELIERLHVLTEEIRRLRREFGPTVSMKAKVARTAADDKPKTRRKR